MVWQPSIPAVAMMAALCAFLPAPPAATQQGDGTSDALEWALVEAETALRNGEPQIADSHYRAALLEGWTLLARVEASAGDFEAARAALERALYASAEEPRAAQLLLAEVELRLGAVDEALRGLQLLARQHLGDAAVRRLLIRALALAGKSADARAELEALREHDPQVAAELAATLEDGGREGLLPAFDAGPLAGRSPQERARLRGRVRATLARIYRNLGAMQAHAGRAARAGTFFDAADAVAGAEAGEPYGRVELLPDVPPPCVKPQELDPAALLAEAPEALAEVIRTIDGGRLDEAETELRRRLVENDDPATRDLLAIVLSHQERYAEAEEELLTVIAAEPGRLPARQHLARLYFLLGRPEDAIEHLRYAAELGDLERDLAFELAAIERAAQRVPAANRQLRSLARRFESARAQVLLSRIAAERGRRKQALDHSRRAVARAPSSEEVLALHAGNALAARIPSTAARAVEPLARMHPTVAGYQALLGRVWAELGNPREAAEALERAVILEPPHLEALLPLGLALNHEKRYADARPHLVRFLELHPGDPEAQAALAEAQERLGEAAEAERLAAEVLARDDAPAIAVSTAHLVVAMVRMREGGFPEARAALEQAVAADPDNAKAHYQLSQACVRLGDGACAREHLARFRQAQEGPEGTTMQSVSEPDAGEGAVLVRDPGGRDERRR